MADNVATYISPSLLDLMVELERLNSLPPEQYDPKVIDPLVRKVAFGALGWFGPEIAAHKRQQEAADANV